MFGIDFNKLRFLICDDNAHMRRILRTLLHSFGAREAYEAEDGATALEMYIHYVPDIMILDWSMPIFDGLELAQMIRQPDGNGNPYTPIIMLTGHSDKRRVMMARDAGVAGGGHPRLLGVAGEHDDGGVGVRVGAGLADHLRELEPVENRHRPVGQHDVGHEVGERLEAGRAVFRFVYFAGAEAVQQRAQDAPHMRVVVDDQKSQPVEIDANHGRSSSGRRPAVPVRLRRN